VIAANEPKIMEASRELQKLGCKVEPVEAYLAELDGSTSSMPPQNA